MPLVRHRLLVAATLVLLSMAVALVINLDSSGREEVLNQFTTLQKLLVRQEAHEVVSYLQECSKDLQSLTGLASIPSRDAAQWSANLEEYYQTGEHVRPSLIQVIDETGAVVYSSRPLERVVNYAGRDFFEWSKAKANDGAIFVSSWARLEKEQADPAFSSQFLLAAPLYRPDAGPPSPSAGSRWSGVLLLTVDLESILTEHLTVLGLKPQAHRVWIMDQDGTILLQSEHPEMARENVHRIKPECVRCHVSFDYAKQMLARSPGITEYQLKGQPKKLAAHGPMRFANASWIVVLNAPYTEVTSFARRSFRQLLLLLGVLAAAISLVSLILHESNLSKVKAEQEAERWQEKHHLEEKLRGAEARYRTLFEQSPDGVVMIDPRTTLPLEFSEAAHRQLGYSRSEMAGLRCSDYEATESSGVTQAHFDRLLSEGQIRFETHHRTKQGGLRIVEVIGRTLSLADRMVYHCIYHDLTDRERAKEALERRTAQLESLHQASLAIAAEMESEILLQTITTRALTLFQGTAGALFLRRPDRNALELAAKAGRDCAFVGSCLKEGMNLAGRVWETNAPLVVAERPRPDEDTGRSEGACWAAAVAVPIRSGNALVGVLSLCSDKPGFFSRDDAAILALFATQAAIAIRNAGLLEQVRRDATVKTTLLHEVNHRVKNNLMRLVEIVRLGREHAPSSEVGLLTALRDLENRLQGMVVIHTMLSTAEWSPLPLRELVTQVINAALSGSSVVHPIQVTVDAPDEPWSIVPEQATALALILNELATNSVKYAFRDRSQGQLEVRFRVEGGLRDRPQVRLEYHDDGPGWPEAVLRGRAKALGLRLIEATVRSPLRGQLVLRNDGGALVELTFNLALPD
jgi:PAS domain S-box-containing protein